METNVDEHASAGYGKLEQGGYACSKIRLVIVCLALLNIVLLIVAVVIGMKCAKVKNGFSQVAHGAATELIADLEELRGNHSDVMVAAEDARLALQKAIAERKGMEGTLAGLRVENDAHQKQLEELKVEKTSLQANVTALEWTCGKCPMKWTYYNSSCYYFSYRHSDRRKNWYSSRMDCLGRGGDLVVFDDRREQVFVTDSIKSAFGDDFSDWTKGSWIGITDGVKEGTWVWINNVTELASGLYWSDGEPNNHGLSGEDCLILGYKPTNPRKTWYDGKCYRHEVNWICEKPSN